MPRYLRNVLNNVTQLLGGLLGQTINANETTSGSAYRRRHKRSKRWMYRAINKTFFWTEDHCFEATCYEAQDCTEILEISDERTLKESGVLPRLEELLIKHGYIVIPEEDDWFTVGDDYPNQETFGLLADEAPASAAKSDGKDYIEEYFTKAEFWENNPQAYVEEIENERDAYEKALSTIYLPALVETYSDDTVFDAYHNGTDLALNMAQTEAMNTALKREFNIRFPATRRDGHGMTE